MRLIRGAPGRGKTAQVFREFSEAIRQGHRHCRIVAPTATLVRHYQHELARQGLVFDPNTVVSLSRLAIERVPDTKLVPPALLRALVRDALTRLALPEFERTARTNGMADVILETITRFENSLTKPRAQSPHAKAFQRVWKDVDAAVAARGFATRGQIFQHAAVTTTARQEKIWIDGFLRFSPLEAAFLRSLNKNADLTLTLTDTPATDDARRLAMELGASDHLLKGPPRQPQTTSVKAPSPEREADEIARRILELHQAGTDFPDIAIALREVDAWLPLLRTTFDRFGIPARYYFSTPVRTHPVAVFLNGLIAAALNDWNFESTLTALRAHPAFGHTADFDRFDFKVREAMPGHGADALLSLCESDHLRQRIADCMKIDSWRTDRARPATIWQRRFEQFAESLYRIKTVAPPTDYAAIETARSHAAAMRAWSEALDTAATFLTSDVTLEQFHAAVSDAVDTAAMRIPDDRRNVVHVMSAFEARQWEVRALFVCGMTARDYPRRAAPHLLFPETGEDDQDEEQLFDCLKTRASEHLILTASTHDAAGRTVVPSQHFVHPVPHTPAVLAVAQSPHGEAGRIGEAALPALAELHRKIGLTTLEDLAKCRFRFYAGRSLKLKGPPDRPAERFSFSAAGLIVHEAMEAWLADRTRDFVPFFETAFDDYCRKHHIQPGYNVEVQRVELRRIAAKVNESVRWPVESSDAEVECEINFPGDVPGSVIQVTCRIDRIDRLGNGDCIIVDYKSGKTQNVKKLVERETSLQGPLYALAVRETKNLNPIAMVFLAVREDKIFGWGQIPGAALDLIPTPPDWIDAARDRTIVRLETFLAGDVHAEPTHPDDCTWCDFRDACRIETKEVEVTEAAGA